MQAHSAVHGVRLARVITGSSLKIFSVGRRWRVGQRRLESVRFWRRLRTKCVNKRPELTA